MIQTSGVDFETSLSLQPLCIDNEEIRKRIRYNNQIQVTSVPCLLIIFPDGGIEKYDGVHIFDWFERTIAQFTPPPPIDQPPSEEEKWRHQQAIKQQQIVTEKRLKDTRIREENKKKYEESFDSEDSNDNIREQPVTRSRRRIKKDSPPITSDEPSGVTSISDLPSDEEDELAADRYRSRRPVGRIRDNEGNYIEGDELFQGQKPDMRKARRSAVKGNSHVGSTKSVDIMSKAKELEKSRAEPTRPPGHRNLN